MPKFIRPEFFDIFGLGTFSILLFLGARGLLWHEAIPFWGMVFMAIVGVLGLIIDGTVVYRTYLRGSSTPESSVVE